MIVNLNTMCTVQLNDFGKQIWEQYIEAVLPQDANQAESIRMTLKQKVNEQGELTLELWAIMNIFGSVLSQTSMPFAKMTVTLSVNPMFGKNS